MGKGNYSTCCLGGSHKNSIRSVECLNTILRTSLISKNTLFQKEIDDLIMHIKKRYSESVPLLGIILSSLTLSKSGSDEKKVCFSAYFSDEGFIRSDFKSFFFIPIYLRSSDKFINK